MKHLILPLILFSFIKSDAQTNSQNLYFNFIQPTIYNPAFQQKTPVTSVISSFNWKPNKRKGYSILKGGANIPFNKYKLNWGTNYSSFHSHTKHLDGYHLKYAGSYLNFKFRLDSDWAISLGAELGIKSINYFAKEDYTQLPSNDILTKGYYDSTNFQVSIGGNIYWKNSYFGINCRNCKNKGFPLPINDPSLPSVSKAAWFINAGYNNKLNDAFEFKIDALLKSSDPAFFNLNLMGILANRIKSGFSVHTEDSLYFIYYAGIKWKHYWGLIGYRLNDTVDKNKKTFEIALHLQLE